MNLEPQNYVINVIKNWKKHNDKHHILKCLHCKANASHNKHKNPQDKIYMFVNRDSNAYKNIIKISKNLFNDLARSDQFKRSLSGC